ncbi:hypothetical protein THRCLA_04489 [Thraustotheca clavata]|uniref:PH domain-containing protein n=1 Tax=Thraustotheca clavata TaxID=74557 RepID=A0A1V9ZYW0_9STRA|nr:hypothetical protein THRCLA_04489 [Thraustotheca clavata]
MTEPTPLLLDGILRLGRICKSYSRRSGGDILTLNTSTQDVIPSTAKLMENSTRHSILSAFYTKKSFEPPYIDTKKALMGWLTKRGGHVKNWKERWCVLYNGLIYYYKASEDVNQSRMCRGVIDLMGATIEKCVEYELPDIPFNSFAFKIHQVALEDRTYYFIAHTTREYDAWVNGCQLDTWQPHWCTLSASGNLSYYFGTDRMAPLRLGVIYLSGCLVEDVAPDEVRYMTNLALSFKLTQYQPEERVFYFTVLIVMNNKN